MIGHVQSYLLRTRTWVQLVKENTFQSFAAYKMKTSWISNASWRDEMVNVHLLIYRKKELFFLIAVGTLCSLKYWREETSTSLSVVKPIFILRWNTRRFIMKARPSILLCINIKGYIKGRIKPGLSNTKRYSPEITFTYYLLKISIRHRPILSL